MSFFHGTELSLLWSVEITNYYYYLTNIVSDNYSQNDEASPEYFLIKMIIPWYSCHNEWQRFVSRSWQGRVVVSPQQHVLLTAQESGTFAPARRGVQRVTGLTSVAPWLLYTTSVVATTTTQYTSSLPYTHPYSSVGVSYILHPNMLLLNLCRPHWFMCIYISYRFTRVQHV